MKSGCSRSPLSMMALVPHHDDAKHTSAHAKWSRRLSAVDVLAPSCHQGVPMPAHRIFATKFSSVYPLYVQKAERKGRTKEEVDRIICWLTGYGEGELRQQLQEDS